MMIEVGFSSAQIAPSYSMSLSDHISWSEKFKKLHEILNCITRLGDILIPVDALPLGG
jgi:hypothetical protein